MHIERKDNIIYFNNDDGIAYGYLLNTGDGYRMAWYAGIVMTHEELRVLTKEVVRFLNTVVIII